MKILNIEEPCWSAWQKYGWKEKVAGVGISNEIVAQAQREHCNVYLYVGKDPVLYMIPTKKIIELATQYKSIQPVGKGIVKVAVIPINELTIVQGVGPGGKLTDTPGPREIETAGKYKTIAACQRRLEAIKMREQGRRPPPTLL